MNLTPKETSDFRSFLDLDIRVGTIIEAKHFEAAKKPAYILIIDFGEFGIKKSSAQITNTYQIDDLINKQVVAIVNFSPKQIGPIRSECLVLGAISPSQNVVLLTTDTPVENGLHIA